MDYTNVEEFIKKSIDKNRIPMILSSKEFEFIKLDLQFLFFEDLILQRTNSLQN